MPPVFAERIDLGCNEALTDAFEGRRFAMIVHYMFHIHPDHKEQAKEELRKLKAVIEKHGGRNFKYFASLTSGTPNRLFIYEIDKLAHFDSLNTDPDFRAVKLDSLYSSATGTTWADVPL